MTRAVSERSGAWLCSESTSAAASSSGRGNVAKAIQGRSSGSSGRGSDAPARFRGDGWWHGGTMTRRLGKTARGCSTSPIAKAFADELAWIQSRRVAGKLEPEAGGGGWRPDLKRRSKSGRFRSPKTPQLRYNTTCLLPTGCGRPAGRRGGALTHMQAGDAGQ